jgi:hypothetical protein
VQGVGESWLFSSCSRSFGYDFEAMRDRVKQNFLMKPKNKPDPSLFGTSYLLKMKSLKDTKSPETIPLSFSFSCTIADAK